MANEADSPTNEWLESMRIAGKRKPAASRARSITRRDS